MIQRISEIVAARPSPAMRMRDVKGDPFKLKITGILDVILPRHENYNIDGTIFQPRSRPTRLVTGGMHLSPPHFIKSVLRFMTGDSERDAAA